MKTEIFTLCHSAINENGKLSILSAFDHINAKSAPVTYPMCAIAMRIRFDKIEEGTKTIRLAFVDADGKSVMPTIDTQAIVQFPPDEQSSTLNLVVVSQQLTLPNFGEYAIDLAVDGRSEMSIPLYVKQV